MEKQDKKTSQLFHFGLFDNPEDNDDLLNLNKVATKKRNELKPNQPDCFSKKEDFDGEKGYQHGFRIDELFEVHTSGVKTQNDKALVSFSQFDTDNKEYHFRVFDNRFIQYDLKKVLRHRFSVMKYMLKEDNISLITTKQLSSFDFQHVFVSQNLSDINSISHQPKEISYAFPLYLYPDAKVLQTLNYPTGRIANLNLEIVNKLAEQLNYLFIEDDEICCELGVGYSGTLYPFGILCYIYAVLHSPTYREKYKDFLRIDFPRIPYPKNLKNFDRLIDLGYSLIYLHLLEDDAVKRFITRYPIAGNNKVEKSAFRLSDLTGFGRVYINETQYFDKVPEVAWNFYIGGYQPAQKWLKDRKGCTLELEDIRHYQKIIVALRKTDRIMKRIDKIEI